MSHPECTFCGIVEGHVPTEMFYEDEDVIAFLASGMTLLGHSIVAWKTHVLNASELPEKDFLHFASICYGTEKALLEYLARDRAVILRSGGKVRHFHHHIYPLGWQDSWRHVLNVFNNRISHQPANNEKKSQLLVQLRQNFNYPSDSAVDSGR